MFFVIIYSAIDQRYIGLSLASCNKDEIWDLRAELGLETKFFPKPKLRLFFWNQKRNPQRFGKSFETEKFRNRNVNLCSQVMQPCVSLRRSLSFSNIKELTRGRGWGRDSESDGNWWSFDIEVCGSGLIIPVVSFFDRRSIIGFHLALIKCRGKRDNESG